MGDTGAVAPLHKPGPDHASALMGYQDHQQIVVEAAALRRKYMIMDLVREVRNTTLIHIMEERRGEEKEEGAALLTGNAGHLVLCLFNLCCVGIF